MSHDRTVNWLKTASAAVIAFGLLLLLGTLPMTSAPLGSLTDLIFWPLDGQENIAAPETRLLSAIAGGILSGWGLMLWQISARLYPQDPALARTLILSSVGVWFVIDGLGSILAGAPLNAALNVGFLLLFFVPLWRRAQNVPI